MMETQPKVFSGRLAVLQRQLPSYRSAFFDLLGEACTGGLSVAAGPAQETLGIRQGTLQRALYQPLRTITVFGDLLHVYWQSGVKRWLEHWDPDVLVTSADPRMLSNVVAINWMHRRGRPVIGWGLGTMEVTAGRFGNARAKIRARTIRSFDGMIAYSTKAAREYADVRGNGENIFVARNAVARRPDFPMPHRSPKEPRSVKVLSVGRLTAGKAIDSLIRACSELPLMLQPELTIVGDGPLLPEYTELSAAVYPRTTFKGDLRGPDLRQVWTESDLFVMPGLGGLAIQEALSHALPVIVGEADGTQQDLVSPSNGWLIRPGDVGDLKAALVSALTNACNLPQMGATSFDVAKTVNLEAMRDSFVDAVTQIHRRTPTAT